MATIQHYNTAETRRTLTIEECAEALGIGRNTAYAAAKAGELPVVKVGGRLLVPKARLAELLGETAE